MADYQVISIDEVTRRVSITPPFPPRKVEGIFNLIQIVVLAIYNSPGRNVFTPERGSGLPALIGTNLGGSDPTEAIALVTERIEKIKDEIIEEQNSLRRQRPSERLSDLEVVSVDSGSQIDEIVVKLRLISEAGDITTIAI